ncbi:MAG TPA: Gfo/Idh/MocA family oxidoreductase, partial [Longimicrobiaceae bacterium]|nr:Gfo/Idh/MocA family oxidoreductase [Longimicrobiaceae bacterium]
MTLLRPRSALSRDRKLRFALVGCGRISGKHVEALRAHGDRAELVAVCDVDPQALEATVQATGARGFGSLTEMLGWGELDAVVLATPSGIHAEQGIQVAQAGKHV